MKFPDKPTCHAGARMFTAKGEWRPGVRGPLRECDYCGGCHLGDLLEAMRAGHPVALEVADWKYGWPHKAYVSGLPGTSSIGDGGQRAWAKCYFEHLLDDGFDDEARAALVDELWKRTGVHFVVREGRLLYARVPYGQPLPPEPST